MPYSYLKFKQNHIFAHQTWAYGASHMRLLLFGNTVKLLETIFHSSCPGASWGPGQWGSRMHGLDAGERAPCTSHGARVVFTCSKKGSLPWRGASPAWAVRVDEAVPSLSQQHLPLPSDSHVLPALCTPESFPAIRKWGAFRKQLHLENKTIK